MDVNIVYNPASRHQAPVTQGDIRGQLQQLTVRQQQFERALARCLEVDAHGLETLEALIATGPRTPTELAHKLGISTAAMTLVLHRLEDSGHIRRERHPDDGRKLLVIATQGTADRTEQMVLPLVSKVGDLIASMTEQEQEVAATFMNALVNLYDQSMPAIRQTSI